MHKKLLLLSIVTMLSVVGCSKTNDTKVENNDAKEVVEEIKTEEENNAEEETIERAEKKEEAFKIEIAPKNMCVVHQTEKNHDCVYGITPLGDCPNTKSGVHDITGCMDHHSVEKCVWCGARNKVTKYPKTGLHSIECSAKCKGLPTADGLIKDYPDAWTSYISNGPRKTVTVPNVVGTTTFDYDEKEHNFGPKTKDVLNKLKLGYKEEIIAIWDYREADKGEKVLKQSPAPGTKLKEGDVITVWVGKLYGSAGKPDVQVPNIAGENYYELKDNMYSYWLIGFGSITYEFSDKPEGTILKQSIAPDKYVRPNSDIDIVVSKGQK